MQLFLLQRLFAWFCSLFEPFLNKVVILLHPTGDDWANCSHGSRIYSDFGVQGKEASSIVFKWIASFFKRNNWSLNVYLDPCNLHFWMSCYAQSFWTNEQSVDQQLQIISKHLDCWQVLLRIHFLLPSHCTAHVPSHELWLRKDTFFAQQWSFMPR